MPLKQNEEKNNLSGEQKIDNQSDSFKRINRSLGNEADRQLFIGIQDD